MEELITELEDYDYLGKCLNACTNLSEVECTEQANFRVLSRSVVKKQIEYVMLVKQIAVLKRLELAQDAGELQQAKEMALAIKAGFGSRWGLVAEYGKKRLAELKEAQAKVQAA